MIGEKLSEVYTGLEDKYYNLLDFLDAKGMPVYAYNDFLEDKGVPSFPFTVAILFLLIMGLFAFAAFGTAVNPTISFQIQNQFSDSLSGVRVTVTDHGGGLIEEKTVGDGGEVTLQNIRVGSVLKIMGEKDGFEPATYTLTVKADEGNEVSLQLKQIIKSIEASVTVVDKLTGDAIANAHVLAQWRDFSIEGYSDASGFVSVTGVPEGIPVNIKVEADPYEIISQNFEFTEKENKTLRMSPKSISLQGKSQLHITVKDEENNLVSDVEITIRDNSNDSIIFQEISENGEHTFGVDKGTSVRISVKKDGFLRYDSQVEEESFTLRQDEETRNIILRRGGEKLTVLTFAGGNIPLKDVEVMLFDTENNLIDSGITGLGGAIDFQDLNGGIYYVTGWKDGYLPIRKQVNVAETESTALILESTDGLNSAFVDIYVIDSTLGAANGADLLYWEKIDDATLPLGVPNGTSDLSGFARITTPTDIVVFVEAKKNFEEGSGETTARSGVSNEIKIELLRVVTIIELSILDADGNPANGTVRITSLNGDLLFDGPIIDGKVFFDSLGNSRVNVEVTDEEGNTYTEQVNLEGETTIQIDLGDEEEVDSLAPLVEFEGIFNSSNEKVEGISKGDYYWLRFRLQFPEGTPKAGFHARVGSDAIAFIDSQEIGIVGFDAVSSDYRFGKSYQPQPAPGHESADMQNEGRAGEPNKWIELYFDAPPETIIAKIKIKAEDIMLSPEFEVHYRIWNVVGGNYFRNPLDSELGELLFSSNKTPLYAETFTETIELFESEALCEGNLCTSYRFVGINGEFIDETDFKPMEGETYALEIDLRAETFVTATLKLDTSKTMPLLFFTGYDIDTFENMPSTEEIGELPEADTDISSQGYLEDFPIGTVPDSELETNPYGFEENESRNTSLTIPNISIPEGQERKIRVYFKTETAGQAFINTQAIAGSTVINRDFFFDISTVKTLALDVSPESISPGQDFTVTVRDEESVEFVSNAILHLRDSQDSLVHSIAGNASNGKGLSGQYKFKNTFDPGAYKLEAVAEGYAPAETEILIAQDNLLEIKDKIKIKVEENQPSGTANATLKNLSSEEVSNITYELIKPNDFPNEFYVTIELPPSLNQGQDGRVTVNVDVDLEEDSQESLHGELEVEITGSVAGKFPTKTKTTVIIDYNKKLDSDCIRFDKREVRLKLIGRAGSSTTEELEIENKCEEDVSLTAKVDNKNNDPNLRLTATPATIKAGESEVVKVTATNTIERMYSLNRPFAFNITFESSKVSKSIPAMVEVWNPRFSLGFPPNLSIWLARGPTDPRAIGNRPLFISNTGQTPITSFQMAMEDETYRNYPGLRVDLLPYSVDRATINPGQQLSPTRYVKAEFAKDDAFAQPATGLVSFHGVVMGRRYPLGKTAVAVNYGGYNCLELSATTALNFASKSTYGTQFKEVVLKNNCAEPVRVRTIDPKQVQGNTLSLVPSDFTLQAKQAQTVRLQLAVAKETRFRTIKVKAVGLMVNTQKFVESNQLPISIDIGEKADTKEGKATVEKDVKVCGEDRKVKVTFPKLSSDCTQGYCDAKELAEYLLKELDTTLKRAKDKIHRGENNAKNFPGCAGKSYCTFASLGLGLQPMAVYMQLDHMTEDVVEHEMQARSLTELKTFSHVSQGTKQLEGQDVGELTGFDFGVVHLGGQFKGCGKYTVRFDGAFQVLNDEILLDGQTILVNINQTQDRTVTPECENKVQNVPNFLPFDEKYTKNEHYESWLGLAWYEESKLKDAAEIFATKLFKEGEERTVTSRQNNNLKVVLGQVEGGLVKVSIEGAGGSDEPKVVTVNIAPIAESDLKKLAKEAAEAVSALKSGNIKGCIDPNDPPLYFIIEETEFTEKLYGKLEIKSSFKSLKISNQETCIDVNVTRKIEDEVKFRTSYKDSVNKTGIKAVRIRNSKGDLLYEEKVNGTIGENKSIKLSKQSDKAKLYTAEVQLCAEGDNLFPLAAENIGTIKVWANSIKKDIPNPETDPPFETKIEACGIHPYDLFEKLGNKEPGTYYATLGWRSPPDKIRLKDVIIALHNNKTLDTLGKMVTAPGGSGVPLDKQQVWQDYMQSSRLKGIGMWTAGCVVLDGLASAAVPGIGWIAAGFNILFDCILPGAYMAARETQLGGQVLDSIGGFFTDMWDWVRGEYDISKTQAVPQASAQQTKLGQSYKELEQAQQEWVSESGSRAIKAGVVTSGLRNFVISGRAGMPAGAMISNAAQATKLADAAADYLAEETVKNAFSTGNNPALYQQTVDELATTFRGPLRREFTTTVSRGAASVDDLITGPATRAINDASGDVGTALIERVRRSQMLPNRQLAGMIEPDATDIGRVTRNIETGFTQNVANGTGQRMGSRTISYDAVGRPGSRMVTDYTTDLAKRTASELENSMGPTKYNKMVRDAGFPDSEAFVRDLQGKMRPEVEKTLRANVPEGGATERIQTGKNKWSTKHKPRIIDPDDAARISSDVLDDIGRNGVGPNRIKIGAQVIDDSIDDTIKEAIRKAGTESLDDAGKVIKPGRLKSFFKGIFSWSFAKSMLKGLGIAAAGQLGGYIGSRVYWEGMFSDPLQNPDVPKLSVNLGTIGDGEDNDGDGQTDEEICDGRDNDGDDRVDEDCGSIIDNDLFNGSTYRIDIIERTPKNTVWEIKKVVIGTGPLSFKTMNTLLQTNKAELIEGDCQGKFAQRGVQEMFGPYIISAENARVVGVNRAMFYLKPENTEKILAVQEKHSLDLAVLLTAMFESNTHRMPDFDGQLEAIATELKTMQKDCSTHECTLEKFAQAHKLKADTLNKTFKAWNELPKLKVSSS